MGRSKFRQAPLRVRPKHKGSDDGAAQTPAESFAALGTALFTGIARGLSPLFWVLPVVMAGLFVSAAHERNRCELCHSPSGDCAPITLGVWDARSFKAETLEPFAGRFNGETVFETSGIVCKATGVHCEWNGDFGAPPVDVILCCVCAMRPPATVALEGVCLRTTPLDCHMHKLSMKYAVHGMASACTCVRHCLNLNSYRALAMLTEPASRTISCRHT